MITKSSFLVNFVCLQAYKQTQRDNTDAVLPGIASSNDQAFFIAAAQVKTIIVYPTVSLCMTITDNWECLDSKKKIIVPNDNILGSTHFRQNLSFLPCGVDFSVTIMPV